MFNPKYFRRFCTFLVLSLLQKFQSPYRASFWCGFTALFEFFGALTLFGELSSIQHSTVKESFLVDNSPTIVKAPKKLKNSKNQYNNGYNVQNGGKRTQKGRSMQSDRIASSTAVGGGAHLWDKCPRARVAHFAFFGNLVFAITSKISRILMEHIEIKNSLDS